MDGYLGRHNSLLQSAAVAGASKSLQRRRTAEAMDLATVKDQTARVMASCDGVLHAPASAIARVCHASGTGCQDVVSSAGGTVGRPVSWRTRWDAPFLVWWPCRAPAMRALGDPASPPTDKISHPCVCCRWPKASPAESSCVLELKREAQGGELSIKASPSSPHASGGGNIGTVQLLRASPYQLDRTQAIALSCQHCPSPPPMSPHRAGRLQQQGVVAVDGPAFCRAQGAGPV